MILLEIEMDPIGASIRFLILVNDLYFFLLCHAAEIITYARPAASPKPSGT